MTRTLGLPLLEYYVYLIDDVPIVQFPYEGSATYMFDSTSHYMFYDSGPMGDYARAQGGTFFRSYLEDGIATIIEPDYFE